MALPQSFLDDLNARSDIVDVVGEYVSLRPKGGSYWGLCPFHGEKTASFHVVPDRQMYHCFGCGKGGGVISFVMEMENLPYIDAVRLLAKKAGLELPEDSVSEAGQRKRARLLALNKEAARFLHAQLRGEAGKEGLSYLLGRGLKPGTITRFGLGFAPEGWDHLMRAMQEKGYSKSELLDAGLASSGKNGHVYDRFRNRVMFPIIDLRGDVIGFGGRVMGDEKPKYLNSPDSFVFNKSKNLFALNFAKTTKRGKIILTEGYMDTIALYQAGFDCAVASLGTSLTSDHARLLSRFTQEAVICYDSDAAGTQAASRAIPLLEKTGLKVSVLRIKDAKDPDEFIRRFGPEAFSRLLDQTEDYMSYTIRKLQEQYRLEDPTQKGEFARAAAAAVAELDSPVEREVFAGQIAELVGIGKESLLQEIRRIRGQKFRSARQKQERRSMSPVNMIQPQDRRMRYRNPRSARAEEGILCLLMMDGSLIRMANGLQPDQFSAEPLGRIFSVLLRHLQEGYSVQIGALEGELSSEDIGVLAELLNKPVSAANAAEAMADYINIIQQESRQAGGGQLDDEQLLARFAAARRTKGGADF